MINLKSNLIEFLENKITYEEYKNEEDIINQEN